MASTHIKVRYLPEGKRTYERAVYRQRVPWHYGIQLYPVPYQRKVQDDDPLYADGIWCSAF